MDWPAEVVENAAIVSRSLSLLEASMRTKAAVIATMVLICIMSTQGAYPWGSLTHAYITNQIVAEGLPLRGNAIYGSTAPDFANYMFTSPYQTYLMDRTHYDFLRVWKMARGGPAFGPERAAAFGFVAHNEEDYTAHTVSQTLNSDQGYIVQKAAVLSRLLSDAGAWHQLGLDGEAYAAIRAELSHEVIEFAGDLFVGLYLDPGTGQLLSGAAAGSGEVFPELLGRAYAGGLVAESNQMAIQLNDLEARSVLTAGELVFRGGMVSYGNLFTGSAAGVFSNVVLYIQQLAAIRGIQVDDLNLVAQVLSAALYVIQADFAPEVFKTGQFVAGRLAQQKIVPF
jgi:hypothetical protein